MTLTAVYPRYGRTASGVLFGGGIGDRVAEGKLIEVADVGEVDAAVADVGRVDREPPGQLTLHADVPRVDFRRVAVAVHAHRRDGEAHAGVHERRRNLVDVAAEETRRVAERRVAQAVEVQVVLPVAFVEDAEPTADGCLPVARDVPGEADARRQVDRCRRSPPSAAPMSSLRPCR